MSENEKQKTPDVELPPEKERTGSVWAYRLFEYVEMMAAAVTVVILLVSFVFRITVVYGGSMMQTLHENDILIISDLFYEPKTGDVIVIQPMTDDYTNPIVKRVIATEGQVVDIDFENWIVTVDGVALDEPYVYRPTDAAMRGSYLEFPYTVEPGRVFVMGDNRNGSTDSRSEKFGPLDERYILGKVLLRVLPLAKFGTIN